MVSRIRRRKDQGRKIHEEFVLSCFFMINVTKYNFSPVYTDNKFKYFKEICGIFPRETDVFFPIIIL